MLKRPRLKVPKGYRVTVASAKVNGVPQGDLFCPRVWLPDGAVVQLPAMKGREDARRGGALFAYGYAGEIIQG